MWHDERVLRTNWFIDPGFEYSDTGLNSTTTAGTVAQNTSIKRSGTYSLKFTNTTGNNFNPTSTIGGSGMTWANVGSPSAGTVLTFSAWIYIPSTNSTGTAGYTIRFGGTAVNAASSPQADSSKKDQWQKLSVSVTATGSDGSIILYFYGPSNNGDVCYYDDVLVETSTVAGDSFSGDSTSSDPSIEYRWTGSAGLSPSQKYVPQQVGPQQGTTPYDWNPERWRCDDIDLSNFAFGITQVENSTPEIVGDFTRIPQRNGVLSRDNRSYDAGSLTLSMWVVGCDADGSVPSNSRPVRRALFERNVSTLIKLLGAQNKPITLTRYKFGPSDGYGVTTPNMTLTTSAYCTGSTPVSTMISRQRAELVFTFTLLDSFWTSSTQVSVDGTGVAPFTINLDEMGDAPVDDAIITVYGPISNPKVYCSESDVSFTYNGNLAAGQSLEVDCGTWQARLNETTSVIQDMTHEGHARLMYIPPRDVAGPTLNTLNFFPTLTLDGTGTTSSTRMTVEYYPKYQIA